jgi:hypothetical protein
VLTKKLDKSATRETLTNVMEKKAARRVVNRVFGSAVAGRVLGRVVPWVGAGITAYDLYDNREMRGEFITEMQKVNEANKNDLLWHVH